MTNKISVNEMILMILSVFVLVGFFVYMNQSSRVDGIKMEVIAKEFARRDSIYQQRDSALNQKIIHLNRRIDALKYQMKWK
jgi:hypothetical protein